MRYTNKALSRAVQSKIASKIARRKRVRYHNDAALFPDDGSRVDRKRRRSLIKLQKCL